jgi:hypothetical protein
MSSKEFTSLLQADGYDSNSNSSTTSKAEYVSKAIQDAIGLPLQHDDDDAIALNSGVSTATSAAWATWQIAAIRKGFQQHLPSAQIQRKHATTLAVQFDHVWRVLTIAFANSVPLLLQLLQL